VHLADAGRAVAVAAEVLGEGQHVGLHLAQVGAQVEHADRVNAASRLTAAQLDERRDAVADLQLVDVRGPGEFALGTIDGASSIPVGQLPGRLTELDPTRPTVVFCAGGYRSSVAASLLRANGFADVSDVLGGYTAWTQRDIRV
jgi:hydroxyacylglutathione hydrolase